MLPKKYRIQKTNEFRATFRQGKGFQADGIRMKMRLTGARTSRFGIIVGKQVFSRAVKRNRVRRLIREVIQINLPKIKNGFDVALVVLPGIRVKKLQDVHSLIRNLFQKARIIE